MAIVNAVLCSGRILVSARDEPDVAKAEPEEPHKKRTRDPPADVLPTMLTYQIKALFVSGGATGQLACLLACLIA